MNGSRSSHGAGTAIEQPETVTGALARWLRDTRDAAGCNNMTKPERIHAN